MTTQPGVLPKNYDSLSFKKMAPQIAKAILGVNSEIETLEKDFNKQDAEVKAIEEKIKKCIESDARITEE